MLSVSITLYPPFRIFVMRLSSKCHRKKSTLFEANVSACCMLSDIGYMRSSVWLSHQSSLLCSLKIEFLIIKVHVLNAYWTTSMAIMGDGCKYSKVDQTSAPVYESRGFLGQRPISSSKLLLKVDYFSWWPLLVSHVLKYRISTQDLQNLSSKVMRKSIWPNIILNVSFMTLNILNLTFFVTFLGFIINLRSW